MSKEMIENDYEDDDAHKMSSPSKEEEAAEEEKYASPAAEEEARLVVNSMGVAVAERIPHLVADYAEGEDELHWESVWSKV